MRYTLLIMFICLFLLFSCANEGSFGVPSSPVGQANVFVMDQLSVSLLEEVPRGFFDVGEGISLQLDPGSGSPWLVFRKVFLYKVPESGLSGGLVDHPSNGWLDFGVKSSPSCFDDDNYAFLNLQDESCCGGDCQEVLVEFLDTEITLPSDLETGSYLLFFAVGEAQDTGEWDVWNWVFEEINVHGEDYCETGISKCGEGAEEDFIMNCIDNHLISSTECVGGCSDSRGEVFCMSCFDTAQDPIPLCSCGDLQRMSEDVTANYKLQNDIDCSKTVNWDDGDGGDAEGFNPIRFSGVFDGQDHIIRDLYINRPDRDYIGLFGRSDNTISDVGIDGGDIKGMNYVGGLVGMNQGRISSSYAIVDVSGDSYVGGLAGLNDQGVISSSYASESVSGRYSVGGLVGGNERGSIFFSYGFGSVSGNNRVGGLVGNTFQGSISSSYSLGSVSGRYSVGGLVGLNEGGGSISSSYAIVDVSGDSYVGGFAGNNHHGFISSSYGSGSVSGNNHVGGLIGLKNRGSTSSSFWNTDSSGMSSSAGGEGKTTAQMKDQSTYPDTWDFTNVWAIDVNVNEGYPYLQPIQINEPECNKEDLKCGEGAEEDFLTICVDKTLRSFECVMGCQDREDRSFCIGCFDAMQDPIPLCSCDDLQKINTNVNANYELQNDIDCSDTVNWDDGNGGDAEGFKPIGNLGNEFSGFFNGQGHVIRNLFINRPGIEAIGLFSFTDTNSEIKNVGVEGGRIIGGAKTGSLVGNKVGVISESFSTVDVSGSSNVGGLAGFSIGPITHSYASGSVSGNTKVGGLVGFSMGPITNSYASGSVSGNSDVGGLIGSNRFVVSGSYASGDVSGTGNLVGGLVGISRGTIINSYASGDVSGNWQVGGLLGKNEKSTGIITNSYISGRVSGKGRVGGLVGGNDRGGSISNSFWDTESSERSSSAAGEGKTSAQLKDQSSYPGSWDFENIWSISPNVNEGYPHLQAFDQS